MPGPALLYYISGHGFGHALRCAETVRLLASRYPQLRIDVRTMAAGWIFQSLGANVHYQAVEIDRGCIEESSLSLNWEKTLVSVHKLAEGRDSLIASESAFIRQHGISLIIADIPWLAGYVAEAAGVPCYAHGNFTWDWIYQPHLSTSPADQELLNIIRGGYQRMTGWLRLMFPHEQPALRDPIDIPLMATAPTLPRKSALAHLGISPDDKRTRVLYAMRGGAGSQTLHHAVTEDASLLYLAAGGDGKSLPPGVIAVPAEMKFWDVMNVCDVIISKLGHGIVTDCVGMRKALLWPHRNGFREDAMIAAGAAKYLRNAELPTTDFTAGNWASHIRALLATPEPTDFAPNGGIEHVASWIAGRMRL